MVEPRIEGISPRDQMGNVPDIRGMAKELKDNIDHFNDLIPPRPDQIDAFGNSIEQLDTSSNKALDMTKKPTNNLMENVQDSALTIQNILTQPLSLGDTDQNVSLVSAAKRHKSVPQGESELSKIGMAFMQYPDQTQALKAELLLTSHDLKS
jgi:uncharacterized membrane protein YgaE (UPF0421/DUF939 family)